MIDDANSHFLAHETFLGIFRETPSPVNPRQIDEVVAQYVPAEWARPVEAVCLRYCSAVDEDEVDLHAVREKHIRIG